MWLELLTSYPLQLTVMGLNHAGNLESSSLQKVSDPSYVLTQL